MLVRVEQRHIDNGQKDNCFWCPLSLAIRELFPKRYHVSVRSGSVKLGHWHNNKFIVEHSYTLDWEPSERLNKYDLSGYMRPFEFELDTSKDYHITGE